MANRVSMLMPPLQPLPSWDGPNLGVGNWSGWTNMGTVRGELMDYTGIESLNLSAESERVSVHQQYATSVNPLRPVSGCDLVFLITNTSATGAISLNPFSTCARNIGDVNAILAGVDTEYFASELKNKCETSSQVLDRFNYIGTALHWMNQKGPASILGKTQGILAVCTAGQEYIFNVWEYFHWGSFLEDPDIGPELSKIIVRPEHATERDRLWLVLVKMRKYDRTVMKKGINKKRDEFGQMLIEQNDQNTAVWQFVPLITRERVVPRCLLTGELDGQVWVGDTIFVATIKHRNNGNLYRDKSKAAAASAFALMFPIQADDRTGAKVVSASHNEAVTDDARSRVEGRTVPHFAGIPTLYAIHKQPHSRF